MLRSRSQPSVCEYEARFVQDRISSVEKHFAEFCTTFAAYSRKSARLRDKGDEVAKVLQTYAESETISRSLAAGVTNFAQTLSIMNDYRYDLSNSEYSKYYVFSISSNVKGTFRDAEVQRLDSKIVNNLSQYSTICKHARDDVKNTFAARDRELNRRRHLDRLRERNPRNKQMISQAESELMKASVEVSRVIKGLEEQIDSFEKRKLHDLKTILLDFILIELGFHAKAVELLTKAYQDAAEIDEAKDLEEFRETMRLPDTVARLDTVGRTSFRQAYSLTNLANRFAASPLLSRKLSSRTMDSVESAKTSTKTNSTESVQIEEYDQSSEETESESVQEKPIPLDTPVRKSKSRILLKTVPPVPGYHKFLASPLIIK